MADPHDNSGTPRPSAEELRLRLDYDDTRLLAECEVHTYRSSGPGGQHRNKTSSAVRLHHQPSGLVTKGAESRSQHQNKARALQRLREALAVNIRQPLPAEIEWPANVNIVARRLKLASSNPAIPHVIALVLDALADHGGKLADAACALGISASSLTRFLADQPAAWTTANRIRTAAGLPALKK
ncbi:MAG: peptide chain release factor-like protein [Planctomycetota bacterium]